MLWGGASPPGTGGVFESVRSARALCYLLQSRAIYWTQYKPQGWSLEPAAGMASPRAGCRAAAVTDSFKASVEMHLENLKTSQTRRYFPFA